MTPSCTHALEEAALLLNIKPGDEVIMPSYTFVSTANAFALRGAKIKFVDIRPDNLNINENLIEQAITERTRAIVPVHYAGNACEMEKIMNLAYSYNIAVVEDAAQGVIANYQGAALGSIGDLGTFSFHETKNFTSGGEGGLLLVNRSDLVGRSEIMREKGTNRSKFLRGDVDKYTWVDLGSSYLPGELTSAFYTGKLRQLKIFTSVEWTLGIIITKNFQNLLILMEREDISLVLKKGIMRIYIFLCWRVKKSAMNLFTL